MTISGSLIKEVARLGQEVNRATRTAALAELLEKYAVCTIAVPLARVDDQFVHCSSGNAAVGGNSRIAAEAQARRGTFFRCEIDPELSSELETIQKEVGILRPRKRVGVFSLSSLRSVEVVIIVDVPHRISTAKMEEFHNLQELIQLTHALAESLYHVQLESADAWAVQRAYLPNHLPKITGLQYECFIRPAAAVGGDYYEVRIEAAHLAVFVVGDVVGKGAAAALVMSCIITQLRREISKRLNNLTDLIATLNSFVVSVAKRYTTLFILVIDLNSMYMRYVSAGHQPAVLCARRDGTVEELTEGGPPIGLADPPLGRYTVGVLPANEGDFIVIATDGVADAQDFQGNVFGARGLYQALGVRTDGQSCKEFVHGLIRTIDDFVGSAEQMDDLTVIAIRIGSEDCTESL